SQEEGRPADAFRQLREQQRVGPGPRAALQYPIVTGDFPLENQSFAHPPNCWMEKEGGLDQMLNQVHPIVPAPHMRQLMTQDLFGFRQTRLSSLFAGQQNDWMHKSDEDW